MRILKHNNDGFAHGFFESGVAGIATCYEEVVEVIFSEICACGDYWARYYAGVINIFSYF